MWRHSRRRVVLHILLSFLLVIDQTRQLLLQYSGISLMACSSDNNLQVCQPMLASL